jgi:hypothetical protein
MVHRFIEMEIVPFHEKWEREGIVPRVRLLVVPSRAKVSCRDAGRFLVMGHLDRQRSRHCDGSEPH